MPSVKVEELLCLARTEGLGSDLILYPQHNVHLPACVEDCISSIAHIQTPIEEASAVVALENEGQNKQDDIVHDGPKVHHNPDLPHLVGLQMSDDFRVILEGKCFVFRMYKRFLDPRENKRIFPALVVLVVRVLDGRYRHLVFFELVDVVLHISVFLFTASVKNVCQVAIVVHQNHQNFQLLIWDEIVADIQKLQSLVVLVAEGRHYLLESPGPNLAVV